MEYVSSGSFIHGLNPLTKLTFAMVLSIIAFLDLWVFIPCLIFIFIMIPCIIISQITREFIVSIAKFFIPFSIMLFAVHGLIIEQGFVIGKIFGLPIYLNGIIYAFSVSAKLLVLVSGITILLLTTKPDHLMRSLDEKGVPWIITYGLLASLLLIPQTKARAESILLSQQSRGIETRGSIIKRIKTLIPLITPLITGAIENSQERAMALELRGIRSKNKTSLFSPEDSRGEKILRKGCFLFLLICIGFKLWQLLS